MRHSRRPAGTHSGKVLHTGTQSPGPRLGVLLLSATTPCFSSPPSLAEKLLGSRVHAPMADVEAAGAAPPAQPPPMMRAAVAVVLRGVLTLAARGLLCGFVGAMWVSNAANIVRVVARRFGGEGSRAAAVAGDVFFVSAIAMILLFPSAVMLLGLCLQRRRAEAGERERRHRQDCGYGTPTVLIFVLIGLAVLEGASGKWASSKEMVAYGFRLCDYGSVGCSAMVCFIFIPKLIAQLSALLR